MKRDRRGQSRAYLAAAAAIAASLFAPLAHAGGLTIDQAVATALQRNRDVIAARLDIESAQLDRVAAGVYPNPTFSYEMGNIILGSPNHQTGGSGKGIDPGPFDQLVQTFGVSDVIDVWNKRGTRVAAANRNIELKRLQVEDALREVVYSVRSACANLMREQAEDRLAHETRDRYADTVRISKLRFKAGEISEADFQKIELEAMKYQAGVLDADQQREDAQAKLAGLLALPPSSAPMLEVDEATPPRTPLSPAALVRRAIDVRPDLRAVRAARASADATLTQAQREAYPDITLGVQYTNDHFTISGDNANTLALTLQVPIPIFDRNQAAIGKAHLDLKRNDNEAQKLALVLQQDVTDAVRHDAHARAALELYEGGMIERSEHALKVAEKSYRAGSISLIDLLEAQRTYIETRADYLKATNVLWQARIDVAHAVGDPIR